jgi:hypothetical protein
MQRPGAQAGAAVLLVALACSACHLLLPLHSTPTPADAGSTDAAADVSSGDSTFTPSWDIALPDQSVPACGTTPEGSCAAIKPLRCSGGKLVSDCTCGCPTGSTCGAKSACEKQDSAVLPVLADAYTNQWKAADNYGAAPTLVVGNQGTAVLSGTEQIFLGFDLSPVPVGATVDKAQLSLTSAASSPGLSLPVEVALITWPWDELVITHERRPAVATSPLQTATLKDGTTVIEVTALLRACLKNRPACRGLRISPASGVIASKAAITSRDGTSGPVLGVNYTIPVVGYPTCGGLEVGRCVASSPSLCTISADLAAVLAESCASCGCTGRSVCSLAGTSCNPPITAHPSADAYTNSGAPDQNYGSQSSLSVSYWNLSAQSASYLRFNLAPLGPGNTVTEATLEMTLVGWADVASSSIEVQLVSEVWDEGSITFNKAPAVRAQPVVSFVPRWGPNYVDVASLVKACIATPTSCFGLRLKWAAGVKWSANFASDEAGAGRPLLTVLYR